MNAFLNTNQKVPGSIPGRAGLHLTRLCFVAVDAPTHFGASASFLFALKFSRLRNRNQSGHWGRLLTGAFLREWGSIPHGSAMFYGVVVYAVGQQVFSLQNRVQAPATLPL